eukprot:s2175_g2.t1
MRFLVLILLQHCAADVPPGCDAPDFTVMLVRSRAYYRSGFFELSDSERVSRILESRELIKEICPVALLQAILLKLEENLVYQTDAFQSLMAQYTLYLHEAIRNEKITAEDMKTWPLDEGVQRALKVSEALAQKIDLSSAMVMNYCQTIDRFGTSHELDWILEAPFGESLDSRGDTGLLTDTDFYIYQVDWPWCAPLKDEVLAKVRRSVRKLHVISYSAGPRREEQTAYFKYIADHWENLPDFTIFVHPDADEHQGSQFLALRRALKLLKTQSKFAQEALAYYPLAQQMVIEPMRIWGKDFAPIWQRFWHRVFGHPWKDMGLGPPRCKWQKHVGYYLLGHADTGRGRRTSLPAAKATCMQLDEDCLGVTCLSPLEPAELDELSLPGLRDRFGRHSCTARRGAEGLQESPEGEVSYIKSCRSSVSVADESVAPGSTYRAVNNSFLFGYAAGDEVVRGELEARRRCDELGEACAGFTCEGFIPLTTSTTKQGYADAQKAQSCTVRARSELIESPSGEATFVKIPPSADLQKTISRATSKTNASRVFQFYTGSQSIVRKDRKGSISKCRTPFQNPMCHTVLAAFSVEVL